MEQHNSSIAELPEVSYSLEGLTLKETTTFQGKTSCREYYLQEVTYQELVNIRLSRRPGLVLKRNGKLYYTEFPWEIYFSAPDIGIHLCGVCRNICNHCKKANHWTVSYHQRLGRSFTKAVLYSGRIEKYKFIPFAIETFNCKTDVYLVMECTNHVYRP